MSAKILQALTDENPDMRKQIGCMNGILQLFDRQHLLTGKRGNHKKLLPGHSHFDAESAEGEDVAFARQTTAEEFVGTTTVDDQRVSIESSRTSISSSSCSSSFSSIDCTKNIYAEPLPSEQTKILPTFQTSKFDSANSYSTGHESPGTTAMSGRRFDIRDAVKDSIYGETRGLSVKTATREEPVVHVPKFKDSPRPLQTSKICDYGIDSEGRSTKPLDLNESLRVLAKLKEAPWYFIDTKEPGRSSCEVRDGPLYLVAKEGPRYSYDERELSWTSFNARETGKSTAKLRDQPRLSLDGREFSMRNTYLKSKSVGIQKELHPEYDLNSAGNKRPTSVVAKLMGLETMPNSKTICEEVSRLKRANQTSYSYPRVNEMSGNSFSVSSKLDGSVNIVQTPRFREPVSPLGRAVMRPTSKFPIEPAPWKQQDKGRLPQKPAFMKREAYMKPATTPSIYSEIEKRLQDLEFDQSNKDLRALKQILEAMQAKSLLENRKKESQPPATLIHKNYIDQGQIGFGPNSAHRRVRQNNADVGIPDKKSNPPKVFESPIVIMKPARLVGKSGSPSSVVSMNGISGLQHLNVGSSSETKRVSMDSHGIKNPSKVDEANNHAQVLTGRRASKKATENFSPEPQTQRSQSTSGTQTLVKEDSSKNLGVNSISPRLQQRRAESDRRARPPIPDSKTKKQVGRQQCESPSPGGRSRPKLAQSHQQTAQVSSGRRNQSDSGDEVSIRSESSSSLASQVNVEVTSAYRPSDFIPSFEEKELLSNSGQEGQPETISGGPDQPSPVSVHDQPSPVSVLDASFYKDELLPSTVKNVSSSFEGHEIRNSGGEADGENCCGLVETDEFHGSALSSFSSEINHKKLASINLLVQKLTRLNSGHDESTTDHIASLCENKSSDHRYISEILLASGLILKDLSSVGSPLLLHPSGSPINPELYLVIEQTKSSWASKVDHADKITIQSNPDTEKLHRKLVFDTVNEILVWKLALDAQVEPWFGAKKVAEMKPTGLKLLRELCSEIDHLCPYSMQCGSDVVDEVGMILKDDVLCRAGKWTDFGKELSGVVLDIERLIFKDLVAEVVKADASSQRLKSNKPRRQLFAK